MDAAAIQAANAAQEAEFAGADRMIRQLYTDKASLIARNRAAGQVKRAATIARKKAEAEAEAEAAEAAAANRAANRAANAAICAAYYAEQAEQDAWFARA